MTRILFFGRIRDVAGCGEITVDLPAGVRRLSAVRDWLADRDPALGEAVCGRGVRVAVNRVFVGGDAPIDRPEEIAFMSPLSGG